MTGNQPRAGEPSFEVDIRPILRAHCYDCHGSTQELQGGLDLRLRRFLVAGGESGPAIVPGEVENSYLVDRLKAGEMPPGDAKVASAEIAVIERWIAQGARTLRPEPESIDPGIGITPEERKFWSFQPVRRPPVPSFADGDRARTPIDAFLLSRLRLKNLTFSADAPRQTLLLRAYLDLIGLPPTPAEVESFLNDRAPDAYERLVDRLLDSPHYGERWARHWLDVAGYADSEGANNNDVPRPFAYKYRDYVIRSLNADKPFDEFLCEQLAGDEMIPAVSQSPSGSQIEKLVATGFLRMAADGTGSGANDPAARNQVVADSIKIVTASLLGLSVGCAQCHDHRYDPVSQTDYYRLRAIFEPAYDTENWRPPAARRISLATDADRQQAAAIEAEVAKINEERNTKQAEYMARALEKELSKFDEPLRERLRAACQSAGETRTPEQNELLEQYPSVNITPGVLYQYDAEAAEELKKYDERAAALRATKPVEDFIRVLTETPGKVPPTYRLHRGDVRQPRDEVTPAALSITAPPDDRLEIPQNDPGLPTTGRRLAYARWLTNGRHPLLTRVIVNRVWMHHFGRGIVGTPSDFGKLGQLPTHPELLDWLALEFTHRGWSMKQLHRLIMTSSVYRQSSRQSAAGIAADPANELYWRMPVQRLDAEVVRDRILATAGVLEKRPYGPAVPVKPDDAGQVVVAGEEGRRSVYIEARRSQPLNLLTTFDAPVMETNCDCRPRSTVATQALLLMNSEFILKQASEFARRIRTASETPPKQTLRQSSDGTRATTPESDRSRETALTRQVEHAWQLAYCRPPSDIELQLSLDFLARQLTWLQSQEVEKDEDRPHQALTNFCQMLLNSNEFLYVD